MRKTRNQTEATKAKISKALQGKKRSESTRRAISEGMKRYWATIPYDQTESEVHSED